MCLQRSSRRESSYHQGSRGLWFSGTKTSAAPRKSLMPVLIAFVSHSYEEIHCQSRKQRFSLSMNSTTTC